MRGTLTQRAAWALVLTALACGPTTEPGATGDVDGTISNLTAATLRTHVEALAHDSMRGRDTGDPGYAMARDYVMQQMERIGLDPMAPGSYLQPFGLLEVVGDRGSSVTVDGRVVPFPEARVAPDWLGRSSRVGGPGIYVGNSLVANGGEAVDLTGAVAFVLAGAPAGQADDPDVAMRERAEVELALTAGAVAVVVLDTLTSPGAWSAGAAPRRPTRALANGGTVTPRPDAVLGPEASRALLARLNNGPGTAGPDGGSMPVGPVTIERHHEIRQGESWNVGGIVHGSDPDLTGEVVVFTAHLDHVGIGRPDERGDSIYNGAHDNALGVAKVLAAAETLAALEPRRSILFLAVGAEESGLLGSLHYLQNPVFPLEATAAAINHDGGLMGARHDDVLAWGPTFSTVEADVEWAATATGLTYSRERKPPFTPSAGLLHRSDHTPFLMAGIPSVYLMPGFSRGGDPGAGQRAWNEYLARVHHRQADDPDPSATYESALALTAMSVRLAWRLANADGMPATHTDAPVAKSRQAPSGRFYNHD